jgi:hypothetical protein
MMTFYNPSALSLFVVIWTAGMAAMMFPAIVPMILVYNRLIDTNKNATSNISTNNQMIYQKSDNDHEGKGNNDTRHSIEEDEGNSNIN